jgi:hypothetical protein
MTYKILTAGASDARGTIANPAARTAADWTKAAAIRVPTGISSIALPISIILPESRRAYGVPISSTRKQTQSSNLLISSVLGARPPISLREGEHQECQEPSLSRREHVYEASPWVVKEEFECLLESGSLGAELVYSPSES